MWESTLFSGAHGFIGIHEALELRGPEPEAAGFDHGLVLIGIVNPLRQDHTCTGFVAVLMRVRPGQPVEIRVAAAQLQRQIVVVVVAGVAVDDLGAVNGVLVRLPSR